MARSIIVLFIVFILGLVAFMLIDDYPAPETKALLENTEPKQQSQAYFFVMGIMAAPEDDPVIVGKAIYESIKAGEDRYINNKQTFSYTDYPDNKKLSLPQGDIFCSVKEYGCYNKIFNGAIDYKGDEHKLLRERYLTFLSMDDYQTLNKSLVDAPFPPYGYLAKAFRSLMLENIQAAKKGNEQQAVAALIKHIGILRNTLEKSDNLIAKMLFSAQISETIDTISILCRNGGCNQAIVVAELNENEISMESSLKREFQMVYYLFKNLDENKSFLSTENEIPQILTPLTRIFFKVNMSTNIAVAAHTKWINQAKLKPADFSATQANNGNSNIQPAWSVRNMMGYILAVTGSADYNVYIARMHDLNLKIALLNATLGHSDTANINIFNPYYGELQKPDLNNGIACMKGPLEDTRNMRCLYLSIPSNSSQ